MAGGPAGSQFAGRKQAFGIITYVTRTVALLARFAILYGSDAAEISTLLKNSSGRINHMKTKMNQLRTVTLVVAMFTGTCLLSAPAKADTAAGEATFKAKCAGCHGADGKGKEAMKTTDMAAADVQKLSDADLS